MSTIFFFFATHSPAYQPILNTILMNCESLLERAPSESVTTPHTTQHATSTTTTTTTTTTDEHEHGESSCTVTASVVHPNEPVKHFQHEPVPQAIVQPPTPKDEEVDDNAECAIS